jgi:hypothetical protein
MLKVNALKSSRNRFMTGHCAPSAIKMLAYDNYSTFCLVHEQQKQVEIVPAYPLYLLMV